MKKCKTCNNLVGTLFLECTHCKEVVHTRCTARGGTPGDLLGDVFYTYTCGDCASEEVFNRNLMPWVDIIGLVLYNLTQKHIECAVANGYFHRDNQIKKFLIANWGVFFPHMKSKRRTWRLMFFDALRKHPQYFHAKDSSKDCRWYRLTSSDYLPNQPLLERQNIRKKRLSKNKNEEEMSPESDSISDYDSSSQDGEPSTNYEENFLAEKQLMSFSTDSMYSKSYVKPSARLSEFLFAGEEETCTGMDDEIDIESVEFEKAVPINFGSESSDPMSPSNRRRSSTHSESTATGYDDMDDVEDSTSNGAESIQGTRVSRLDKNPDSNVLPWLTANPTPSHQQNKCLPMTLGEEARELTRLNKKWKTCGVMSVAELQLHRKLAVRKIKRERGLPLFNVDAWARGDGMRMIKMGAVKRALDRYHKQTVTTNRDSKKSFWMQLTGHDTEVYSSFVSPYTNRTLKAYIRQDYESRPLWLRLCREIRTKSGGVEPPLCPITYSYVRPQHIPAVNSLAQQYFWPGINLSECLQYPDYSCVVLYKKLVVGFAFLIPDVKIDEAYISFIFTRPEWRNAGIATFMIYHLIQTCIGKDITLHVSATNPALLLYQKFGFKVEEFVQDFYDKYLPIGSRDCRHALFLRLSR